MIQDPHEEMPPDTPLGQVTIHARVDAKGVWEVWCPEWKCQLHSNNLTKCVAVITAAIEDHNDKCQGEVPWWEDWNKFAEENGLCRLRKEQWPNPPPKMFGLKRSI